MTEDGGQVERVQAGQDLGVPARRIAELLEIDQSHMSLYRRPNSPHWWTRFQLEGSEVRLSTGTGNRREAEEFETVARTRAWRQVRLGERPPFPWREAATHWLAETRKRSKRRDESILAWFDEHLNQCDVQAITREVVQELRALKAAETSATEHNEAAPSHAKLTQGSGRSVGKIDDFRNGSSTTASASPKTVFCTVVRLIVKWSGLFYDPPYNGPHATQPSRSPTPPVRPSVARSLCAASSDGLRQWSETSR